MYTDNVVLCIMQNINHQQVVYTHHFPQSGTVCSAMAELSSSICLGGRPLNMDTQSLAGDAGEVTLGCQTWLGNPWTKWRFMMVYDWENHL